MEQKLKTFITLVLNEINDIFIYYLPLYTLYRITNLSPKIRLHDTKTNHRKVSLVEIYR